MPAGRIKVKPLEKQKLLNESEAAYIDRGPTRSSYGRKNHLSNIFFCKFLEMVILPINPQKRTFNYRRCRSASCPKETYKTLEFETPAERFNACVASTG